MTASARQKPQKAIRRSPSLPRRVSSLEQFKARQRAERAALIKAYGG